MLFLLDGNVRTVKWNGIPLHEASSAIAKEETNGDFYLTVRYPITDSGIYQLIKEDMLIKAPVPVLGAQLFRIKKPIENDDSLDITAYHISDDIMRRSIKPISVVQLGCAMALSQMVQNAKTDLGDFSFTSDISDNRTFNTTETETLYSVLMDGKHSIVGTWEGELVRDNFDLSIKRSRGADRGVIITTHKNLKSYQRTKNSQNVVTRIHARSTFKPEGAEDEVTLKVTVDSPLINSYPYINEKEYENNNAKTIDDLKKWAEAKFKNEGIDKVSDAIKIEAYELDGQVVHLGDTVNLKSRKHSADLYKKAIAYEFNALTEEYISITFDDKPGVGGSGMSSGLSNAADAILGASATAQDVAIERALKNADAAFDAEFNKRSEAIKDDIEKIKARAEANKAAMTEQITQKINQSKSEVAGQLKSEFDRKLATTQNDLAGVRANLTQAQSQLSGNISQIQSDIAAIKGKQSQSDSELAKQAQSINQAKSELAGVQTNLTQAQSQLTSNIAQIRSDVGNIRTKQGQQETEIGKQVAALNAAKTELAGVKSAQATFEQTTTRRLTELANVADGKVSKSELVQTAEELKSRIASVHLGRRNLLKGTKELARYKPASEYNGFKVIRTVAGATSYRDSYTERTVVPTTGTEYIAIFYARASENDYPMRCHFYNPNTVTSSENSSGYNSRSSDGLSIIRLSTDWQLCWVKWTQTTTDQAKTVIIGRHGPQVGGKEGVWVEICAPALFEGNLAGDWSPAYEDQEERVSVVESTFKQKADSLEAGVSSLREGLKTKADSSALTVLSDRVSASVKSLETDTQNKLDSKLSTAEFNVRASGISQEIINATKDKADKTLVTAEAGKLREELASLQVGENLFINSEFKNLRDNGQRYTANGKTYQNMIAPYWYNPYNAGIPNAQNIQHGYFDTSMSSDTVFAFNESDGSRHWKALSTDFKIGAITAGEYYFSADLYATDLGTHIKFGFYYHNSTGKLNFYAGQTKIEVTEKGRWVRLGAPLKVNDDIDLTKKVQFYIYGYNFASNSILYLKKPKVSKGRLKSDWSPALEDVDGLITEAKSTFERTAQGLRTDLSAIQSYVNADGARAEALQTYSREETARQLTAERKAIEASYVAKAQHTEDVRGLTRRFEELKSSSETKLAEYRQTVEGQFATMSSKIGESLKKTDISITPGQITLGTGKVVNGQTLASLFVQNPESMQAITKLMRITGDLIVDGSITGRDLAAGAITTPHLAAGAVTAEVLGANAVTADKVKADDALLEKLSAGEALLKKLMAKDAFVNRLQSIDFTAEQVKGGMIKALNGALKIDLNNGQYNVMTDQAAIRRVLNGYPNQFLKFTSETEGGAPASVTVLGANRDGTENSKNDSFAGIRLFSGNKVERTEIISDVVRFATGAVNYRGWEMRTLYGNDNRQVILQPFGNVTRSNIVANYFNGIDLVNVLETLNQMMANLGNHTGRHDIFGPIRGLGARKYVK